MMKKNRFSIRFTVLVCLVTLMLSCGGGVESGSSKYTVGGRVSGMKGSVVLQYNGTEKLTITWNGLYTFDTKIKDGGSYKVTVVTQPAEQICTVTNGNGRVVGSNVTIVNVLCTFTSIARVSVVSSGTDANDLSSAPAISGDGRFIAFRSLASDLVPGDNNGKYDIFVFDRIDDQTSRVSVNSSETEADGPSNNPSISSDGRYVAFESEATNLVPNDTNGVSDIFVRDRDTGQTTRISVDSTGTQATGQSNNPSISGDGKYIAFRSFASDLVQNDTNGANDIFVHNRITGQTIRVSVDSLGTEGDSDSNEPSISSDGRYVIFRSLATNLVPPDFVSTYDIYLSDYVSRNTFRISVNSSGDEGDGPSQQPSISSKGEHVAFESSATNLLQPDPDNNTANDIFVSDSITGRTTRVSVDSQGDEGDGPSYNPSISSDGRYVAFESEATNLVDPDDNNESDIFIHDRATGQTTRISVDSTGAQATGPSHNPSFSGDIRYVAFESEAPLVTDDTNSVSDIYVAPLQ
jgi:Tol biopolymer transport system component